MKLSDVISGLHLPIFAEVPLLIFMGIFVGVAIHLLTSGEQLARVSALPLRDERSRKRRDVP